MGCYGWNGLWKMKTLETWASNVNTVNLIYLVGNAVIDDCCYCQYRERPDTYSLSETFDLVLAVLAPVIH